MKKQEYQSGMEKETLLQSQETVKKSQQQF